jgi:hypothetical protein
MPFSIFAQPGCQQTRIRKEVVAGHLTIDLV